MRHFIIRFLRLMREALLPLPFFFTSVLKLKHNLTRLKHEETTGKTGVWAPLANIQPSGKRG